MNITLEKIKASWSEILAFLRTHQDISDVVFDAYLKKPLKLISYDKNMLTIEVPQEGYVAYLNKNLLLSLRVSIAEVLKLTLDDINITFIVANSEKNNNDQALVENDIEQKLKSLGINPSFTFESFVQGATNEMAYATSIAVSESPGGLYNPLFIYGGTGLGKTHLLSAIAHHALIYNPEINVLYKTCESFKNEFIQSVKVQNDAQGFRDKYRNVDIFIVDDIQALIGADATQEEFFNTFNTLFQNKKQIVISSDNPPANLSGIKDRLKSRFSMGAMCDVKMPDYETRIAILRKKEEEYKSEFSIDTQVINFIAQKVQSNIRELEGCLKKIILKSRLDKKPVNLDQAKKILSDISKEENRKITPDLIIKTVADYFNVDVLQMCGKKRNMEYKYPRNICIYLCRELIKDITQEKIGSYFSSRDHATIINSCNFVDKKLKTETTIRDQINAIKKRMLIV